VLKQSFVVIAVMSLLFVGCTRQDKLPPLIKDGKNPDKKEAPASKAPEDDKDKEKATKDVKQDVAGDEDIQPLENLSHDEQCKVAWSNWRKDYAAANPVLALTKNSLPTEWQPTIPAIGQIVNEKNRFTAITFSKALHAEGSQRRATWKASFGPDDVKAFQADMRNPNVVTNIKDLVDHSYPEELVIVSVDHVRSMDYFLETRNKHILYATPKINHDTPFFTPETQSYIALRNELRAQADYTWNPYLSLQTAENESGVLLRQTYERIWDYSKTNHQFYVDDFSVEAPASEVKSNIIVVSDYKGLNSTKLLEDLPTADCLHALGFTKVKVGLQDFSRQESITDSVLGLAIHNERLGPDYQKAANLDDNGKSWNLLQSGKVNFIPTKDALVKKVNSYKGQAEILYLGLEN
jgi:hypothetical protein